MALEVYKKADSSAMLEAQRLVVQAVMPLVDRGVHPLVICFALMRCVRVLYRKVLPEDRAAVRPALVAFLDGRTTLPEDQGGSALWTPDSTKQ